MIKQAELVEFLGSQQRKQELSAYLRQEDKRHAKLEGELLARLEAGETVETGDLALRPNPFHRLNIDWKGLVAKFKGDKYVAKLETATPLTAYPHLVVEAAEASAV